MRPSTLADPVTPAFLGLRQQHEAVDVRTAVRADLAAGEEVGLTVRQSERDHVRLFITGADGDHGRRVAAVHRQGDVGTVLAELPLAVAADDLVTLTVSARGQDYTLLVGVGDEVPETVAVVDGRTLDSVATGGFLGLWFGVYATSNGRATMAVARVERFEYVPVT